MLGLGHSPLLPVSTFPETPLTCIRDLITSRGKMADQKQSPATPPHTIVSGGVRRSSVTRLSRHRAALASHEGHNARCLCQSGAHLDDS